MKPECSFTPEAGNFKLRPLSLISRTLRHLSLVTVLFAQRSCVFLGRQVAAEIGTNSLVAGVFSTTRNAGAKIRATGWEMFSADLDPSAKPTLLADVLALRTDQLPPSIDCIRASPPCAHYVRAITTARTPMDLRGGRTCSSKRSSSSSRFTAREAGWDFAPGNHLV